MLEESQREVSILSRLCTYIRAKLQVVRVLDMLLRLVIHEDADEDSTMD